MKPAILVVDDDIAVCTLLQDVLSEHVFAVTACHTGQEALRCIETQPEIALVLLDMMLPDINGLMVLQQVQKDQTRTTGGDADRAWQRVGCGCRVGNGR